MGIGLSGDAVDVAQVIRKAASEAAEMGLDVIMYSETPLEKGSQYRIVEQIYDKDAKPDYECDGIAVYLGEKRVMRDGQPVSLTKSEFRILEVLVNRQASAVSREYLFSIITPYQGEYVRKVDTHISSMRRKLGKSGNVLIESCPGLGYRLRSSLP